MPDAVIAVFPDHRALRGFALRRIHHAQRNAQFLAAAGYFRTADVLELERRARPGQRFGRTPCISPRAAALCESKQIVLHAMLHGHKGEFADPGRIRPSGNLPVVPSGASFNIGRDLIRQAAQAVRPCCLRTQRDTDHQNQGGKTAEPFAHHKISLTRRHQYQ